MELLLFLKRAAKHNAWQGRKVLSTLAFEQQEFTPQEASKEDYGF